MGEVIFWVIWALVAVSAMVVAFSKNLVYSVFSLLATFIGVAGIYIFLNADFLAVTQIVIYVGGILVLLVFGIMLTNRIVVAKITQSSLQRTTGLVVVGAIFLVLVLTLLNQTWPLATSAAEFDSTVNNIGELLFGDYLILFEVASVLLLGALIGAATLARKEL
ncbi:MAG: NADH-quinone oxidoreductase subunit J [Lentisphaeria bacterium]|nr:NADH-quinone oxidoreductase subunit J [Candidatus Neomarinimicrobiota bacterium]MCF7842229.1 NADH-quinone oxidoreductase subunit J [Lentisphaeria bacterium]